MTRRQIEPAPKRARGRPKGTGIDDAARLASIAAMLSDDRGLKATTAIKRAGVSDPSAIRRLREKLRAGAAEKPRLPVAALATARAETVTAELPPRSAQSLAQASPEPEQQPVSGSKHPPLAAETEKRTREALLLAAYLEAMSKSPPPTDPSDVPPMPRSAPPEPPRQDARTPEPASPPPRPEAPKARSTEPQAQPQAPFSFPGMPPFLQPFRQPEAPPHPGTSPAQQLEGMKLAVEAMTSMTKLQLHITENALAYSPLAMMLQGQAMVGQMLLASFTGQLDAMKPKKPK
jgi:hypothetical protein